MPAAGYGAYRKIQTETSSPGELVVLLYDALLNDLARADLAIDAHDMPRVHERLLHAQDIVLELAASLDRSQGEMAEQLAALYDYCYRRLLEANIRKDPSPVREVSGLLQPVRDAWRHVVHGPRQGRNEGLVDRG